MIANVVEVRTDTETEPFVISPPHMQVLRERAGESDVWNAGPLRLSAESLSEDPGSLSVRLPPMETPPAVRVIIGGQTVQELNASGRPRAGYARYELGRIADTIAEHRHADLVLPIGHGGTPLAFIRPRRLATGVRHMGDHLLLHDVVTVDGLMAAIYAVHAPWRDPAIVPVYDESIALPSDLVEAGPLLISLQIENGWTFTEWPRWPTEALIATAHGFVRSQDDEETALSAFLAGRGPLPGSFDDLGRLWSVVDLASELRSRLRVPELIEACAAPLQQRPMPAMTALVTAALAPDRSLAAIVTTGLAAAAALDIVDPSEIRRMWSLLPAAAVLATGGLFDDEDCLLAAESQCGETLSRIRAEGRDPHAKVGGFGPEVAQLALMAPGQLAGLWSAANVVPRSLLDPDTRMVAARQLFDARTALTGSPICQQATTIVRESMTLIARSSRRDLAAHVQERSGSTSGSLWMSLPMVSSALAIVARLAARGDQACRQYEQAIRGDWSKLAHHAPELVTIDLLLAELLLTARPTE